jgi:hypothetical protein
MMRQGEYDDAVRIRFVDECEREYREKDPSGIFCRARTGKGESRCTAHGRFHCGGEARAETR